MKITTRSLSLLFAFIATIALSATPWKNSNFDHTTLITDANDKGLHVDGDIDTRGTGVFGRPTDGPGSRPGAFNEIPILTLDADTTSTLTVNDSGAVIYAPPSIGAALAIVQLPAPSPRLHFTFVDDNTTAGGDFEIIPSNGAIIGAGEADEMLVNTSDTPPAIVELVAVDNGTAFVWVLKSIVGDGWDYVAP